MIDYLKKGKSINGQNNALELRQGRNQVEIQRKAEVCNCFRIMCLFTQCCSRNLEPYLTAYLSMALNFYPIPLTHQTEPHLTCSCFLNSNSTCIDAILETMMRSYMLWRRFWRTRIPPFLDQVLWCQGDDIEKLWKTVLFL